MSALKESGFATAKNTKHLKDSQDQLKQVVKRKKCCEKKEVSELASLSPANASKLRKLTHSTSRRSPLDDTNPDLHKPLSTAGTRVDSRRCTNILHACKTLDDLRAVLLIDGYICFSCAALYFFLFQDLTQLNGNGINAHFQLR